MSSKDGKILEKSKQTTIQMCIKKTPLILSSKKFLSSPSWGGVYSHLFWLGLHLRCPVRRSNHLPPFCWHPKAPGTNSPHNGRCTCHATVLRSSVRDVPVGIPREPLGSSVRSPVGRDGYVRRCVEMFERMIKLSSPIQQPEKKEIG